MDRLCIELLIIGHLSSLRARVAQCVRWLDYPTTHTSLSPIRRGFATGFVNYNKGALDSQLQVIKFTSCLPMVGGSLRALRLKYCWKWRSTPKIKSNHHLLSL